MESENRPGAKARAEDELFVAKIDRILTQLIYKWFVIIYLSTQTCINRFLQIFKVPKRTTNPLYSNLGCPLFVTLIPINTSYSYTILGSNSPVKCLLGFCSPATIFRRVITISINSIKGVLRGRLTTHIINKLLIANAFFKPSITDFYTPTPIKTIRIFLGVIASIYHRAVSNIKWVLFSIALPIMTFTKPPIKMFSPTVVNLTYHQGVL